MARLRRESAVPRSVVMGLDTFERRVSFFAAAVTAVLAAILSPHLFKNTWITDTASPTVIGKVSTCPTHYHLITQAGKALCTYHRLTHPSEWLPQFLEIVVCGLVIALFAWRKKRAGVAATGILLGLALGSAGLLFLFLGGWLVLRAFRLQKYGTATMLGSSRRARELSEERRAERLAAKSARGASATRTTPQASKRYTPKAPRRTKK